MRRIPSFIPKKKLTQLIGGFCRSKAGLSSVYSEPISCEKSVDKTDRSSDVTYKFSFLELPDVRNADFTSQHAKLAENPMRTCDSHFRSHRQKHTVGREYSFWTGAGNFLVQTPLTLSV